MGAKNLQLAIDGPGKGQLLEGVKGSRGGLSLIKSAMRSPRGRVSSIVLIAALAFAFVGPFVAPYSPTEIVGLPFAGPSSHHLLGGDALGRDVLSRLLCGGWRVLILATLAVILGVGMGTVAGIVAAYRPGIADSLIMRTVDILLAFPQIVFALILMSVVGPRLWLLVVAIGLTDAPQVARVVRSSALDICERDFVRAAQAWGIPGRLVMFRNILPNLVTPLMVEIGLRLSWAIIIMSGLSFLGFGLQPPVADWGRMINENRIGLIANPWSVLAAAIMLAIVGVAFNTFADAVSRVSLGVEGEEIEVLADMGARGGATATGSEA